MSSHSGDKYDARTPTWNGDIDIFEDSKTDVKMLQLDTDDSKMKLLAPRTGRNLTGKAKQAKHFPELDKLRSSTGVEELFDFLEDK